ncbi:MAG: YwaF family protein [Clostridia bacterium]|nr:YwaF family protein [Clostridia bacterium]
MDAIKEFFGVGGYKREPEGFLSWQHILFVTVFIAVMVALAVILGRRNRNKDEKTKNKVIAWAAIILLFLKVLEMVVCCLKDHSFRALLYLLPLFLCSMQMIALPLAAFSKGRLREAALDFVFIFGILGAVMGTYGAGQNFSCYPILSFDNVLSVITHTLSGFASLYIAISGLTSMRVKNIWITFTILCVFCVLAYIADILIPYNYMFLMRGDGTPYDIFYNLVKGNRVLYPMCVVLLFLLYLSIFYLVYFLVRKHKAKQA